MTRELEVTYHDDRAGDNPEGIHFGFVYFNDDRRVAYTDEGVEADVTGDRRHVTATHVALAKAYLTSANLLSTRVTK